MRWLLVSAQHHPTHGGIGTYVSRFVASATVAGWEVELITRSSELLPPGAIAHVVHTSDMDDDFQARLGPLRRLNQVRPYRYALWSCAVAERIARLPGKWDAVEFVDCQAEGYATLGSASIRNRFRAAGTPVIVHAHTPMFAEERFNGADDSRFGRRVYHQWEREALRRADGVIATSALLAQLLDLRGHHRIIPYPIAADSGFELSKSCGIKETILLVGSVQPRKGVDVWAQSLNLVLAARPHARAMLIGPDTANAPDGLSMAAHMQRLIRPRLLDRFRWIGALSHDETLRAMERASLVVVPSLFDSFSFVAAEALLRGTPVLVSDAVGLGEHVPALPRVNAGDVHSLAQVQIEMLSDYQTATRQALVCREQMLQACSPELHLRARADFVVALKFGSRSADPLNIGGDDTLEEMQSFIASIEELERTASLVSSARS